MQTRHWIATIAGVALAALITTQVVSQDPGDAPAPDPEMMAKWGEFMTPGKEHQELMARAGEYDLSITMVMAPGAPPTQSTATAKMEAAMGGRYLIEHTEGDFMGSPFRGMGITGYDNLKKVHFATWIDNMGTGTMTMEGTREGNVITFKGDSPDVMQGKYVPTTHKLTLIDDDHFKLEMMAKTPEGAEYKTMEIVYSRKGAKEKASGSR